MADTSRVSYHFGSFELLVERHQLLRDGEAVPLGQRALDVLTALVERAGELVTKEELLEIAWPGLVVEENNLQVQVSTLRKILGNEAIATSAGRGYRFVLEVARRNATQAAATRKIDLIAVLPLENLNRLPSEEYFADGMTESLITSISKVSGLKVIARNSVMRFRGAGESLAGIGRVLGAGAIVEGSVLHSGASRQGHRARHRLHATSPAHGRGATGRRRDLPSRPQGSARQAPADGSGISGCFEVLRGDRGA
ncbi:MAG: tetratricopeptide repeat protein [Burkholderiaceae bacterium]|nr:tetratricopeptide repeat protein [Burkholderiaceae bacterium]